MSWVVAPIRSGWKNALAAGAVTAGLVLAGCWASRSSLLDARHVNVRGNVHLTPAEVEQLAGVSRSTNVLRMDTSSAEQGLLQDPWVARAVVSRSLPWTVSISITEREPVGVERSGGRSVLVAGDGTNLGHAGGGTAQLPQLSTGAGSIADAAGVMESLPPTLLRDVTSARGGSHSTVCFVLRGGTKVTFGTVDQAAQKAASLSAVLEWAATHHKDVVSIDVSAPEVPTARLRSGALASR